MSQNRQGPGDVQTDYIRQGMRNQKCRNQTEIQNSSMQDIRFGKVRRDYKRVVGLRERTCSVHDWVQVCVITIIAK